MYGEKILRKTSWQNFFHLIKMKVFQEMLWSSRPFLLEKKIIYLEFYPSFW